MEISDQLRCLFSAQVEERDGSYVVEVPKREVRTGSLAAGDTYRVALVPSPANTSGGGSDGEDASRAERRDRANGDRSNGDRSGRSPPVDEGEERTVEIEDIGEQGDGITRVERGFVVIVPDTDQGERVTVEITDVRENVAFAEVVERRSYYE
ncbi:TRAM domain-containing protein [Halosimplex litoreum]|uniref:TRAM domain-containing protein n=1 Tax=Halosimplex litoreum TaxID=1198301 RepID=A0A7T3FVT1_9EURY|nr:TRAM domain-containing protein [Halosimplex litoreum]QPV61645.1 TRAM domain-containing protein [Halosimplex litoreum]